MSKEHPKPEMPKDPPLRREDYLFDQDLREQEAIERILLGPTRMGVGPMLTERAAELMWLFGYLSQACWVGVRVPKVLLVPADLRDDFKGDVDIMGGLLDEWPPRFEYVGAAEVKCSYMDGQGTVKATQLGGLKRIYAQTENLVDMGFDSVSLLWIGTNEPVVNPAFGNFGQFTLNAARAGQVIDKLQPSLTPPRSARFGVSLIGAGATPGALENFRSMSTARVIVPPPHLEHSPDTTAGRVQKHLRERLREVFAAANRITGFGPVVLRACAPGGCDHLFVRGSPEDPSCPRCGRTL